MNISMIELLIFLQQQGGKGINISMMELLIVFILLAVGIGIARTIAPHIADEQRKIVGGIALLLAVPSTIYGIIFLKADQSGFAAIMIGLMAGAFGIVLLKTRSSPRSKIQASSIRKCPYCAEQIQLEAKICRFCGKTLDASSPG